MAPIDDSQESRHPKLELDNQMRALHQTSPLCIDKKFEMPSIPLVLTRIIQLLDNDNSSTHELETLILHDPPLSARILKLANSAFYSFRSEVRTISHAIPLLGFNLVKSLAIGVHIFDSFTKGLRKESALINGLWMHSFAVGMLAQETWKIRSGRKEGEFAFLCGLIHDIGKAFFFMNNPVLYAPIFALKKGEGDPNISSYEAQIYSLDHASVGAMLASAWGLPPELVAVIREHHNALNCGLPIVGAVAFADLLAKQCNVGFDGDAKTGEIRSLQEQLKMTQDESEHLHAFCVEKQRGINEFFKSTL